jgi:branched-chain amino acid aminotransferase
MSLLWINGQLIAKADAKVSPFDHGFLYGDGVWEHFRVFGGKLFRPDDQLSCLCSAARNLSIEIPLSQQELRAAIEATVRVNNRTEGYVRVIVTRGPGTIGPDPRKLDPQVIIIAEEYQPFPAELYAHGLHVVTSELGICSVGSAPLFRLLGQRHIIKAKTDALGHGCLEAVLVDDCNHVYGCTEGNLFRVLDGVVRQVSYYPFDVTQRVVRDLAVSLSVPIATTIEEIDRAPTPDDLRYAEEVFLVGTSCGVIGIVRIDGHAIGSGTEGPVTRAIRQRYHALTRENG